MARLLYIFPHPDDESFGPAPAIARQRREGHAVYLLTLTKGEATQQRHQHGYSKAEMGAVREREMQDVAEALDLTALTVLDFPDGELAALDPLDLEAAVRDYVDRVRPDVLVTYAVHGISGHPDHLVTHAVVKRVFCAMRAEGSPAAPQRLALFTLIEAGEDANRPEHLQGVPRDAIDCLVAFEAADRERAEAALACYRTYQDVVEEHQPLDSVTEGVPFVLFAESPSKELGDLAEGL